MSVQEVAARHYVQRQSLVGSVIQAVALWWTYLDRRDLSGSWEAVVRPGLVDVLTTTQRGVASTADTYLAELDREWGVISDPFGTIEPEGFAGLTADQRSIEGLMDQALLRTRVELLAGTPMEDALRVGELQAQKYLVAETQDAGRVADEAAMVMRPTYVGFYRYLQLPSCARCVVLAGRWYKWSEGFQRHDRCDCLHVPTPVAAPAEGRPIEDPMAALATGQVTGLSKADLQAIQEEGADLGRVVNAKKGGLRTIQSHPRARTRRLSPDLIYRRAGGNREEVARLLAASGYILPTSTSS